MENKVEQDSTNFFYAVGSRTFLGSIQAAGQALRYVTPWSEITKLATLPPNIPAKFSGNKIGWLIELPASKNNKPATTPPDATVE